MEAKKDIKKEIERYLKYNYSKNDVMIHLKRDGFSADEIKEHISVFDKVDSNYMTNILYFLPALLFLIPNVIRPAISDSFLYTNTSFAIFRETELVSQIEYSW